MFKDIAGEDIAINSKPVTPGDPTVDLIATLAGKVAPYAVTIAVVGFDDEPQSAIVWLTPEDAIKFAQQVTSQAVHLMEHRLNDTFPPVTPSTKTH